MSAAGKIMYAWPKDYINGWAELNTDSNRSAIAIVKEGKTVSTGVANGFSTEILKHGAPHAWCAFHVRLPFEAQLGQDEFLLIDQHTRKQLDVVRGIEIRHGNEEPITSLDELINTDPTILPSIEQLSTIEPMLRRYVDREGEEKFVKAAYIYILGRPADVSGLAGYANQLKDAKIECVELLRVLAGSEEYASRPRQLQSPASVGFPFR